MLLPTSLVGSYPQPDWLIDRDKLSKQVPRVRADDLWLVGPRQARSGAGRRHAARDPRPGARRARHHHRRRAAARKLFQPLRHRARRHRHRQSRHHDQPQRPADPGAARGRPDPAQASGRGARPQGAARQYRPQDQGDRAGPVHHGQAGAGRLLQGRGSGGDGLRRRRQCRDQGSVRRRRRRGADRRAVDAAASGQGPAIRPQGAQPRARRRHRHGRGASVLRLCRRGARQAVGLFVPGRARGLEGPADLDRGGAAQARPRDLEGTAVEDHHSGRDRPVRHDGRDAGDRRRPHPAGAGPRAGKSGRGGAGLRHEIPAARGRLR